MNKKWLFLQKCGYPKLAQSSMSSVKHICDLLRRNREQVRATSVWFDTVAGISTPYLINHATNPEKFSQLSHLTIACPWQIETTVCTASRLDVMSLSVDCVFQTRYHETLAKCMESLIAAKHTRFMVIRSEVRNFPEMTSRLITKLYKLYWF